MESRRRANEVRRLRDDRVILALVLLAGLGIFLSAVEGAPRTPVPQATAAAGSVAVGDELPPVGAAGGTPRTADEAARLPDWVQTIRPAKLWDAVEGGAAIADVGQWHYLRVRAAAGTRLHVEGDDGGGSDGWVDLDDVGISTAPPSWVQAARETQLFVAPAGEQAIMPVPAGARLRLEGEAGATRQLAYLPVEPTARRSGYGWVETDALVPASAPTDVALPAPGFRPVKAGRADTYRVRPRDTMGAIAARHGVHPEEMARANELPPDVVLTVGQALTIPPALGPPGAARPAPPQRSREAPPPRVSAEFAVVLDAASGAVLWERNGYTRVAPASLTKNVTALVVLDHARLTDLVNVRVDSRRMPESTVMGLHPGEQLSVEDLLYGLMLPSGNDAALALAAYVAGTREVFAELMNEKVRALGLTDSHFLNPHGLDAVGHLSTAYDQAMIAREGFRHPAFAALAGARTYQTPRGGGYHLTNLNRLLATYPGADGVKIGYTDAAGRAIVASATRAGHRVIVALIRSVDLYADSAALLDWAFTTFRWTQPEN